MNYKTKVISRLTSKRRPIIESHLRMQDINFEFLDAADKNNIIVNGSTFNHENLTIELNTNILTWDSFKLRGWFKIGEVGCFLSHYKLWKQLITDSCDFYLILEDDAELTFDVNKLNYFFENENLRNVDLIFCQSVSPNFPNGKRAFKNITEKLEIKIPKLVLDAETIEGTAGYIVSKSGANKLIKHTEQKQFFTPVDNFIGRIAMEDLDCYLCPNYLQIILRKDWSDTEIHYETNKEQTTNINGVVFKFG